jgi:4-hydroxythreonine-4-phosphate dehydrogenase
VIGDAERLRAAGRLVGSDLGVVSTSTHEPDLAHAGERPGTVDCIDLALIPPDLPWGKLSAVAGDAAFRYIQTATELAMAGKVAAICTAPINKEALHAGGHIYPGHTELLAVLTGTPEVSMCSRPQSASDHVTTHRTSRRLARSAGLVGAPSRGTTYWSKAGIPRQKIGCGINPHAGKADSSPGRRTRYSRREACRAKGWDVEGPPRSSASIAPAVAISIGLAISRQGHGPVKVLGLDRREHHHRTAGDPDVGRYGTAFDIARRASRRTELLEALRQAIAPAPADQNRLARSIDDDPPLACW